MFDFLDRQPVRDRLNFGQGLTDQGRTAVLEFKLPKDNTDSVIGAVGAASSNSEDILKEHVIQNVDEVHSGDVIVESGTGLYRVKIRIENKRPEHVEAIDEQMSQMFRIEDSRIHVV